MIKYEIGMRDRVAGGRRATLYLPCTYPGIPWRERIFRVGRVGGLQGKSAGASYPGATL